MRRLKSIIVQVSNDKLGKEKKTKSSWLTKTLKSKKPLSPELTTVGEGEVRVSQAANSVQLEPKLKLTMNDHRICRQSQVKLLW